MILINLFLERNEHHCILQCLDDRKKVDHNVLSRTQKRANIDCRCKKGDCSWTTHGKTDIALKGKIRQNPSEFVVLSSTVHGRPWSQKSIPIVNKNLGFECKGKGKLDPIPVPSGCNKSPEDTCTPVTQKVQLMNSWTCRNCFRIRAFYKFKPFNLLSFNNQERLKSNF